MVVFDLIATFSEDGDNPYPADDSNMLLNKLRVYRKDHPEDFLFITDWKENLHSRIQQEQLEDPQPKLFGKEITETTKLSDVPALDSAVKSFFLKNKKLEPSKSLLRWARNTVAMDEEDVIDEANEEEDEEDEEENEELDDILTETNDIVQLPENEIGTYNFASNYTISYDDLAKLCIRQARRSYLSSKARSLEIEKEEIKRRNELYTNINKYFNLAEISADLQPSDSKLDKMTIAELEILQKQCEDKFDMLKTKDMLKNILATFEIGYEAWFPDGIPIGKKKRWTLDPGIPKQLSHALFDERSVPGHAFRRILDKHHIHLPDEATVALEIAKIIIKGSHIVDKSGATVEELEDDEEEEYDEEEEEENNEEEEESDEK